MLELTCRQLGAGPETVLLRGFSLFCAGYTGRDSGAVMRHVDELAAELGVPPPDHVPTCYPMASRLALADADEIEVYGEQTSGEAEPVLVILNGKIRYLGLGSDHTDRAHERHGIAEAKNLCPKVLATDLWAADDVLAQWDRLELRAWSDGDVYQEATLSTMLEPEQLLAAVPKDRLGAAAVLMCGTVPTVDGKFKFGSRFECSLRDPVSGRELRAAYGVRALAPIG